MMIKSFKRSDLQNLEHSHTEIRQLDAARDESYRTLQFTVRAAKHRRATDSIAPNHSTPRNADSVPFGASHGRSCRR